MTPLPFIGAASLAFVVVFTYYTYRKGGRRRLALIETWMNIGIGFSINFIANMVILPLAGADISAGQNFWIGWAYTVVSILRQYAIRRWFQEKVSRALTRFFKEDV